MTLILALAAILATWTVTAAGLVGIGLLFRRTFAAAAIHSRAILSCFWLGFCAVIAFLQLWHLFLPITDWTWITVLLIGGVGLVLHANALAGWLRSIRGIRLLAAAVFALLCLFAADRALGPCTVYDSGLYHLSTIRWLNNYAIVPGLGNLHGRLAFNSSHLLFAAMMNTGRWAGRGNHVANGLLLLGLLAEIVWSSAHLRKADNSPNLHNGMALIFITPMLMWLLAGRLPSPETDWPAAATLWAATLLMFRWLSNDRQNPDETLERLAIISLLAASITMKLSSVFFAGSALLLITTIQWRSTNGLARYKQHLACIVVVMLFLLPWMIRGVVLSGYPLYPNTLIAWPAAWRVPAALAHKEAADITRWAREYYIRGRHQGPSPSGWRWLGPWARNLPSQARFEVVVPTVIAIVAAFFVLIDRSRRNTRGLLLLIPLIIGCLGWLALAPGPRFGFYLFWAAAAVCIGALFQNRHGNVALALLLAIVLIPAGYFMATAFQQFRIDRRAGASIHLLFEPAGSDHGLHPTIHPQMKTFTTASGLKLYTPVSGDQCWDADLPCTPNPRSDLRLLRRNYLSSGFALPANAQPASR